MNKNNLTDMLSAKARFLRAGIVAAAGNVGKIGVRV